MDTPILESTLTCPVCGHVKTETCHTLLKPRPGDCCVFCSYGSVPCPPVQQAGRSGCCGESG